MKVTFENEEEFKNFRKRKCPIDLTLKQNRCVNYACEKCWEEALKSMPENIEIEVKK